MKDEITVFMEYKINAEYVQVYSSLIKHIKKKLQSMGASNFHSYKAADQDSLYVEFFQVKDYSLYNKIKEARLHPAEMVFSDLHEMVEGGIRKIHCWAFIKQELEDED
ncbi:hypothetical protein ACFQPF_18440 [Fictibacillus iocasae]|uniref:DUF4286 domain-containing protein n=1 Tax=Fictibacillus iocasae TaxID=2715437 RepID=A0ABW2NW53_9BACL